MKKFIKPIIFLSIAIAIFGSCKKDDNKVSFEGGTAPVLTASSTADLILSKPNGTAHAITFSWTNPEYQFSTGISSQDVTYYLEIDTTGSGFTTPENLASIPIAKELSIDLTDSVLNYYIAKIGPNGLKFDVPHSLEFRIKSTINGGEPVLYSSPITVVVTPYLDAAVPPPPAGTTLSEGVLFLTGSGSTSGWTNDPPAPQQFTKVSEIEYTLITNLQPGLALKFVSYPGNWQPQYGQLNGAPAGTLAVNLGGGTDPDEIPTPSEAGTYKITVLFGPGKFKFEKQ